MSTCDLFRIIERNFDMFDPRVPVNNLVNNGLLNKETQANGINILSITEQGKEYIKDYKNKFKDEITKEFNNGFVKLII